MFPFASGIEFVQTAMSFVAVVLLTWALWDALRDVIVLQSAGVNGTRLLLARSNLRTEIAKLCVVLALIIGGVISILLPPPSSLDPADPQLASLIEMAQKIDKRILQESRMQNLQTTSARIVAMLVTFILVFDSVMARRVRRKFIRRVHAGVNTPSETEWQREGEMSKAAAAAAIAVAETAAKIAATVAATAATVAHDLAQLTPQTRTTEQAQEPVKVADDNRKQIDGIEKDVREIKKDVKEIIE